MMTTDKEPVAWAYELAHCGWTKDAYSNWQKHLSWTKPQVPEGSIRNLTPLYAKVENDAELLTAIENDEFLDWERGLKPND